MLETTRNKTIRFFSAAVTGMGLLAGGGGTAEAAIIQLDYDAQGGATQANFTSGPPDGNDPTSFDGGNINVNTTFADSRGPGNSFRPDLPDGVDINDLVEDFIFSDGTITVEITGLPANPGGYRWKSFHHDTFGPGQRGTFDVLLNGTTKATGQSHTKGDGDAPFTEDEVTVVDFVFSHSSPGTVTVELDGTDGNNHMFNGFTVTAVPEPATGMMLALGGGLLLGWRRQ